MLATSVYLVPYVQVHDNVGYGFDPHDDSDYVTINNNHVYNNGWHGISEFSLDVKTNNNDKLWRSSPSNSSDCSRETNRAKIGGG